MPMSRTPSHSKPIPTSSRIVRKTTEAPRRSLRAVGEPEHRAVGRACLPPRSELFGVAMRICRDPDTAKGLVQETLLRAMCAWDSVQTGSHPRGRLLRLQI